MFCGARWTSTKYMPDRENKTVLVYTLHIIVKILSMLLKKFPYGDFHMIFIF